MFDENGNLPPGEHKATVRTMLRNERQLNSAKAKLRKWLEVRAQLLGGASAAQPEWIIEEQKFGVEEQIKELQAEIQEYEDTVTGRKQLRLPAVAAEELPYLLIRWRLRRHWTQKQLAERVNLHENQIQKYESENYAYAALHTITEIATVLQKEEELSAERQHAII